jgi:hypothetical protein
VKNININMKHFPDDIFNFLKQNYELATVTKLFSCKRRVVCTPYLPDLRKVEIFTFFAGHLLIFDQKTPFFKNAGSRRRLNEIALIFYRVLEHMSTMCGKNLVENGSRQPW